MDAKEARFRNGKVEAGSRPAAAAGTAAAAAAAAAGVEECRIFLFFSKDSDVTLGTFAVDFGRRFGTKLGGVLMQKRRVSGRQGGCRKQPEKNEHVEVDRVWVVEMISWTAAGAAAAAAAAAAAGIDR